MLSGDNGILQKATEAKTRTERQSIVEQARTDVLGYQAENKGGDLDKTQLKSVLDIYFKDVPDLTNMSDTEIKEKQLDTLAKYGTHTITVSEIYDGNFISVSRVPMFAKDKLVINSSAENDYEKSPYVNYIDANGNSVLCRILYNDADGVEIISNDVMKTGDTVDNVPLGSGDTNEAVTSSAFDTTGITGNTSSTNAKKAAVSYNRAVTTLNEVAEGYRNKTDGIADRARCVGSNPKKPEDITDTAYAVEDGATNAYIKTYGYNNKFKVTDEIYKTDYDQMGTLGIRSIPTSGRWYWLASRRVVPEGSRTYFYVRSVWYTGDESDSGGFSVRSNGTLNDMNSNNGFRSVFHLTSGVKVTGGSGTLEEPYEIGI